VKKYSKDGQATDDNMRVIWRMRFACWITKAVRTFRLCDTAFPRQQWFRERASIWRYRYIVCLVDTISHPPNIPFLTLQQIFYYKRYFNVTFNFIGSCMLLAQFVRDVKKVQYLSRAF
jgi:hypothetical protein